MADSPSIKTRQPRAANHSMERVLPADCTFRRFIENLPVMFYAVSPEPPHRPLYISPSFANFGYAIDEWLDDSDIWDRIIHPEDRASILSGTREAMQKGNGIDYEYRVICADGRLTWVRDRGCFIYDPDGTPICWQGVILDITDKRQAEQELEKREKLYRTLARTLPKTAVVLFDHDLRYTLADGEQLKCHKWQQEMFERRTLWEV